MLQSLIAAIYPPQCVLCDARTDQDFALCGSCWAEVPFIDGLVCDKCGVPLPGVDDVEGHLHCDDCMAIARPWSKGRAALVYSGKARGLVLSLKHGDRTDLARAVGPWMGRAGKDLVRRDSLILPIPLHRFRLLRRKYNQAALLSAQISAHFDAENLPNGLVRNIKTKPLEGKNKTERFSELQGAISVNSKHLGALKGRHVVLVDDVMTSGATFAAAADACINAGADDVCVLALARVMKDG